MVIGGGDPPIAHLVRLAECLRHPLRCRYVPDARIGEEAEFLSIAPETVHLSALIGAGNEVHLRVVQMAGEAAEVKVTLPIHLSGAELIDFQGTPFPGLVIGPGNTVTFPIKPWQIVTVRGRIGQEDR
jgi:hypothetical protein